MAARPVKFPTLPPPPGKNRMNRDVMKLMENEYEVMPYCPPYQYIVKFFGPKNTPYENGVWAVRIYLPGNYPYQPPIIGFHTTIFHPNIDPSTGQVCIDVLGKAWTALYDLCNIFDTFLPQLLTYPNPTDPLNHEAAKLMMTRPEEFRKRVREYVKRFGTLAVFRAKMEIRKKSAAIKAEAEKTDSESSLSDYELDEDRSSDNNSDDNIDEKVEVEHKGENSNENKAENKILNESMMDVNTTNEKETQMMMNENENQNQNINNNNNNNNTMDEGPNEIMYKIENDEDLEECLDLALNENQDELNK